MPSAAWIRAIIGIAAALMFGVSALTGDSIDHEGLRWLTGVASAVTLLLLAFDQWLWRAPGIRWLCEVSGRPVIHGTWWGRLDYENDGEGNPGTTEIYTAIHQTFSSLSVRCYFPKTRAESWCLAASLRNEDHRHDLRYIYQQQAEAPDRDHNRPTEGACHLAVAGRPVRELSGSYFSERGGRGRISLTAHSPEFSGTLAEAERLGLEQG